MRVDTHALLASDLRTVWYPRVDDAGLMVVGEEFFFSFFFCDGFQNLGLERDLEHGESLQSRQKTTRGIPIVFGLLFLFFF